MWIARWTAACDVATRLVNMFAGLSRNAPADRSEMLRDDRSVMRGSSPGAADRFRRPREGRSRSRERRRRSRSRERDARRRERHRSGEREIKKEPADEAAPGAAGNKNKDQSNLAKGGIVVAHPPNSSFVFA